MEINKNNFAQGNIARHITNLAGPMIVAQLINVLYNVIDRVYIGRIPEISTLAMGGLGLCLPLISIIIAFANLFGMGGSPLCSIARGQGKNDEAEAPAPGSVYPQSAQGLPVLRVPLLAGDRLYGLLPGAFEGPGAREVTAWPVN